jgi:hypothetical protein
MVNSIASVNSPDKKRFLRVTFVFMRLLLFYTPSISTADAHTGTLTPWAHSPMVSQLYHIKSRIKSQWVWHKRSFFGTNGKNQFQKKIDTSNSGRKKALAEASAFEDENPQSSTAQNTMLP